MLLLFPWGARNSVPYAHSMALFHDHIFFEKYIYNIKYICDNFAEWIHMYLFKITIICLCFCYSRVAIIFLCFCYSRIAIIFLCFCYYWMLQKENWFNVKICFEFWYGLFFRYSIYKYLQAEMCINRYTFMSISIKMFQIQIMK